MWNESKIEQSIWKRLANFAESFSYRKSEKGRKYREKKKNREICYGI